MYIPLDREAVRRSAHPFRLGQGALLHVWFPQLTPDGSGGATASWFDLRSSSKYGIYAQRMDAPGNPQWTAEGVRVRTA